MINEAREWDWLLKSTLGFVSAFTSVQVSAFMVDGLTAILLVFDIHILNEIEQLIKWFAAIIMSIVGVAIIIYQFRIKIKELQIKSIELKEREISITDLNRYAEKLKEEVQQANEMNIKEVKKRLKNYGKPDNDHTR